MNFSAHPMEVDLCLKLFLPLKRAVLARGLTGENFSVVRSGEADILKEAAANCGA